jgi:cyclopropane-fatty-acyl-phospholipid synthase
MIAKTSEAWLKLMDSNRSQALLALKETYGEGEEWKWLHRWRIFYLAVAELFNYRNGQEWGVTHYLFGKKAVV